MVESLAFSLQSWRETKLISSLEIRWRVSTHSASKLKVSSRKTYTKQEEKLHKYTHDWTVVTENIREEIKNFLDSNENKTITHQNLWGAAKEVLKGKVHSNESLHEKKNIRNISIIKQFISKS